MSSTKPKFKNIKCITNRAIKICMSNFFDLELDNIYKLVVYYTNRNDYVGRTSQRFHVRRKQHVTKKLKNFIFNDDVKPKGEQSSIHEHLVNNRISAENYLESRFEILSRARYTYNLSVLES